MSSYETKEGEKRTVYELKVEEVGPSLRSGISEGHEGPTRTVAPAAQKGMLCLIGGGAVQDAVTDVTAGPHRGSSRRAR